MILGPPLPMGTVELAETKRLARNSSGVRLEVSVAEDGSVRVYSPDIYTDFIEVRRGRKFYFDVGVRQESAHDVIFETGSYIVEPEGRKE